MQVSDPSAVSPAPRVSRLRRLGRFLFRTRRGRFVSLFLFVLLASWAVWYNEHRTIGWGQTFNPFYWYHRFRGDDLYLPDQALLLHGNRGLPEIALTFDDGPHPGSREEILDILKRYGARATFFDVGKNMAQHPDLVRRTLDEGHEIANHSQNHNRLDSLDARARHHEINDTDITFCRLTGGHLALLRPPGMRYNDEVLAETKRLGYIVVGYTTASQDFDTEKAPEFISERTLRRTENGSILLLHDYPGTASALPQILETLRERGYRCVTISEMLAHLPDRQREPAAQFLHYHTEEEIRKLGN